MNNTFTTGPKGEPRVIKSPVVNLGLAVDLEKRDGSRTLLVPCIRGAESMDFAEFISAYDDIIRKASTNKLSPDDFSGVTVTLTNPGTIGTERSVPRLMPGQGVIVGVGALDYPTEYAGADPRTVADLGISKIITISSTYDHRIIQGAESGMFLRQVHDLLLGEDHFYEQVFAAVGVPYVAVPWKLDVNPVDREESMIIKQMQVATLINMYRPRSPHRGPGSTRRRAAADARRAGSGHLRPDHLGPGP